MPESSFYGPYRPLVLPPAYVPLSLITPQGAIPYGGLTPDLILNNVPVASQPSSGGHTPILTTDGNDSTYWQPTDTGPGTFTLTWDLGSAKPANRFYVLHGATTQRGGNWAMVLDGSNDNAAWTNLGTITPITPGAPGINATFTFAPQSFRYWRLTTGGSQWAQLIATCNLYDTLAGGAPASLAPSADGQGIISIGLVPTYQPIMKSLGVKTVGASQLPFAHGLLYLPTLMQILMTSAGSMFRSQATDATNIYLTADAAARTAEIYVR